MLDGVELDQFSSQPFEKISSNATIVIENTVINSTGNEHTELERWFSTGVPQGGARVAASYHVSMNIRPILTPRDAAGR